MAQSESDVHPAPEAQVGGGVTHVPLEHVWPLGQEPFGQLAEQEAPAEAHPVHWPFKHTAPEAHCESCVQVVKTHSPLTQE